MRSRYRDRFEAGAVLAGQLSGLAGRQDLLVLALPRGGVPVAFEVARRLGAELDVFVVRKLGVPGQEQLAMGAIASGGIRVLNESVIEALGIDAETIDAVAAKEQRELERQEHLFRRDRPAPRIEGRTVVLVDDGLATGSTMLAALRALRQQSPARVIVAVPVAAAETCELMQDDADEVVCAATPEPFHAVGLWYEDFEQTSDEEVRELLERAQAERQASRSQQAREEAREVRVDVPAGQRVALEGDLAVPEDAIGVVLFAHGSGSSRHSPRNREVARVLQRSRLATLLIDLLTPEEAEAERYTRHLRFDIDLLADRVVAAVRWLSRHPRTQHLPIGCFGASTGAAAALVAAAREPGLVRAVVSRGGRPDLAGEELAAVRAPTLLIVGGEDHRVIEMNREAFRALRTVKELQIVPGATHLFEEPGALERVAQLAAEWFVRHLSADGAHLSEEARS
jgi:putative phosphoribosyl transferase